MRRRSNSTTSSMNRLELLRGRRHNVLLLLYNALNQHRSDQLHLTHEINYYVPELLLNPPSGMKHLSSKVDLRIIPNHYLNDLYLSILSTMNENEVMTRCQK